MPNPARRVPGGWPLVGLLAAAVALMSLTIAGLQDFSVDGVRAVIRATARTSLVLFCLAFSASALRALWPAPWTVWLLNNRRYLGLSFAASHAMHAVAIVAFASLDPQHFHEREGIGMLVLGGLGYAFIVAMAATSSDAAVAWLGARRWRALHWIGGHYLWLSFMTGFAKPATVQPLYLAPVLVLLAIMAVRLVARARAARRARPLGPAAAQPLT
jgi:hypothetical protein